MQVRVLRLGLLQDGGYPDPQLLPRDHDSHSASKERPSNTEANPLLRPFSHSGAMYAATQVSPLVMDFIGKRMMVSEHKWIRNMWWLPQSAGTSVSLFAGVHNTRLVP